MVFLLDVTVDGTQQEILLKDLKPETQYSVYVQATALNGTTKSSERFFKTIRFGELSVMGSFTPVLPRIWNWMGSAGAIRNVHALNKLVKVAPQQKLV